MAGEPLGRQAADAGTYATALLKSGNKESIHQCPVQQFHQRTAAQNPNRTTLRVSRSTVSTSKHGFQLAQITKLR